MWKQWLLVSSVSLVAGIGGTVAYTHLTVHVTAPVVQVAAPPACPSPDDVDAARKMIEEAGRPLDTSRFVPRGRVLSLEEPKP